MSEHTRRFAGRHEAGSTSPASSLALARLAPWPDSQRVPEGAAPRPWPLTGLVLVPLAGVVPVMTVARRVALVLRYVGTSEHAPAERRMGAHAGGQLAVHRVASAGIPCAEGGVGGSPVLAANGDAAVAGAFTALGGEPVVIA